jgi:hypothetical protein
VAGAKFIEKKEFLKYSLVFCSVRLNEHSSTEELKCGPALLPLSYCSGAASSPTGPVKRTQACAKDLATFASSARVLRATKPPAFAVKKAAAPAFIIMAASFTHSQKSLAMFKFSNELRMIHI